MKNICVFCSSSQVESSISDPVIRLCSQFASHGYDLVWGGSDVGLMKIVADSVKSSGAKIHGVSLERLSMQTKKDSDTMFMAKTLTERVDVMIEKSDGFVILPGGSGTLDELAHVIEMKRLGFHKKPIVLFNIDGFFDGLIAFFKRVSDHNMQFVWTEKNEKISGTINEVMLVAHTDDEVMKYLGSSFRI